MEENIEKPHIIKVKIENAIFYVIGKLCDGKIHYLCNLGRGNSVINIQKYTGNDFSIYLTKFEQCQLKDFVFWHHDCFCNRKVVMTDNMEQINHVLKLAELNKIEIIEEYFDQEKIDKQIAIEKLQQ